MIKKFSSRETTNHISACLFSQGQNKGQQGEESVLAWEDFPWSGIIKTYNTDKQVPDSAGTATAIFRYRDEL